jgi:ER membrane protein complex subunit 4
MQNSSVQSSSVVASAATATAAASASSKLSYKQRKWFIDFTRKPEKFQVSSNSEHVSPIGYSNHTIKENKDNKDTNRLIGLRSWDIALGPIKQAPMNVFISWMAGNSIALFPIMFVGMLLFRPLQSMFTMSKAFEAIEPGQYSIIKKITYLFGNLVNLAIALYKCHSMGLLPTYASDWLAFETPQEIMEYSFGGFSLS